MSDLTDRGKKSPGHGVASSAVTAHGFKKIFTSEARIDLLKLGIDVSSAVLIRSSENQILSRKSVAVRVNENVGQPPIVKRSPLSNRYKHC